MQSETANGFISPTSRQPQLPFLRTRNLIHQRNCRNPFNVFITGTPFRLVISLLKEQHLLSNAFQVRRQRTYIPLSRDSFDAFRDFGDSALVRLVNEGARRNEARPESELVALRLRLKSPLENFEKEECMSDADNIPAISKNLKRRLCGY